MNLLLALAWFLVSGGLAPAAIGHAAIVRPASTTRSISAAEHRVDVARPGERSAADWRRGSARAPVPHAPGGPETAAAAGLASPAPPPDAALTSFPATAARAERPRRIRFPTEATAPPAPRS